jgi:ketosteroid isomerase-like protein
LWGPLPSDRVTAVSAAALSPSQVVEQLFRLGREGRLDELVALFASDMEGAAFAGGTRSCSGDDVNDHIERHLRGNGRSEVTCSRIAEHGDRVLVEGRLRVLTRRGLSDSPAVWVFRVREGRIAEVRPFESLESAHAQFPVFVGTPGVAPAPA